MYHFVFSFLGYLKLYVKFMPFPNIICNLYVYFQLLWLQLLPTIKLPPTIVNIDEVGGKRLLWSKPSHSTVMVSHSKLWMLMNGVGVRLLWSKPLHSTEMGSHPPLWMLMNGVEVRLLWRKHPYSTAMSCQPPLWMLMNVVEMRLLWSKPRHCTDMGSQPSLWMLMNEVGERLLWSKPPHSTAMGSHPHCECWWMGWEWGCYEANLPIAKLWAPTPPLWMLMKGGGLTYGDSLNSSTNDNNSFVCCSGC